MHQPQHRKSGLEIAISGFGNAVAAVAAILLLPLLARHIRYELQVFLASGLDYQLSVWGSWLVIILVAGSVFFGVSALVQAVILLLFRRSPKSPSQPF